MQRPFLGRGGLFPYTPEWPGAQADSQTAPCRLSEPPHPSALSILTPDMPVLRRATSSPATSLPHRHIPPGFHEASPFQDFWMGGYEGADHVNGWGMPLDANVRNGHGARLAEDYAALGPLGIRVVRESIGWRLIDRAGDEGFRALARQAHLAAAHGLQVVWTLMHYGWPDRLDPFERPDEFVDAFAAYCRRVAETVQGIPGPAPVYQPVNEISFLAWAATRTGLIWPHAPSADPHRGQAFKRVLVRAALRGADAVWSVAPLARLLHTDPVMHVEPPCGAGPGACADAAQEHAGQFEAWDMLCGRAAPELGGAPRYLDLIGLNYYHNNQWEHGSHARLHWHLNDTRRRRPSQLIADVWQRYRRPLCLSETGHVGVGRSDWLDHIAAEAVACRARGIPLLGMCLYPLIDRPDWQEPQHWHHSGLWDLPDAPSGGLDRRLCAPYADRLRHWQHTLPAPDSHSAFRHPSPETPMTHLIVFSHLRWDFVYQRPQQLLSRLAARHPVLFVEEPMPGADRPWLERYSPCAGVEVLRMHMPGTAHGFDAQHMDGMRTLLLGHLLEHDIHDYVLWFYTPMALPLAEELTPRGSVYDCMDELSAFDFAPKELLAREEALLRSVDLVFTGGRSLYESKRGRHADVHCFPSSVDHAHFGQTGVPDHPDQAGMARPRLGYYGVIDERLDLALMAAAADAHPDWQWVMVGPVVKIDPASLPQRPNLHWMGQRRYDELPAFLSGWDVCLMPFALNASTRFISPTKTLEYLAAGKPAVSTDIHDVRQHYAGVVPIAQSHAEFVAACERILGWGDQERADFQRKARAKVAATSWDLTAAAMQRLLERFDDAAGAMDHLRAPQAAPVEQTASAT